jgi:hypothetical protein
LDELSSNGCNEQSCVATVAFTPLEEETGAEVSLVGKVLGHCAADCRLASARHTVQPEYTFAALIASPGIYLSKEFHSSASVASGIVFFVVGVERSVVGGLQFIKDNFLMDAKDVCPIGNIINF